MLAAFSTSSFLEGGGACPGESEFQTQHVIAETGRSVMRIRRADFTSSYLMPLYAPVPLGPYKLVGKLHHILETLKKKKSQHFFSMYYVPSPGLNSFHSLFP